MPNPPNPSLLGPVASGLLLALLCCGCDDEEIVQDDTTPIVGVMELAVSLRHADTAPANAVRVEVSPTQMRVDGHDVVALERGRFPAAERSGDTIPKLAEAIRGGPARRAAAMRLHVGTPWETTALILKTIEEANIHQVGFEVRPPGGGAATGWTVIDHFEVVPASDEPVTFERGVQRHWAEWVEGWEDAYHSCRRDFYVDCAPKPSNPAQGGEVELRFFARGSALKVEFHRFGVQDDEPAAQARMLDGIAPPTPDDEEEEAPPVTEGAFTWRFQAATDERSPISGALRPLCGARRCGVVLTGDPGTMTLRLLSMLGAAFPDGLRAPYLVIQIPAHR